ncbi:TIGR03905 family TSCPD domain-containing protein [Anaerosalibacter massiliensis]|uniref:ribonucleoside-diphosphate reductase n=1 Tax=Anaerosalibacter massiliensis TaxID=1347392 RepID=A0A9X2MIQ9_9FIRM|nr:TIGR03905 family TSCPD domain-containing protein [Anaerosalibacter massiliensis]MCR2044765.1 TIGR03905 family TSCPD domain-containing protein [Anaerosalibacter massiliensis]
MQEYFPKGVCSRQILFDVENGKLKDVKFIGGCSGNLKGISSLVEGMDIDNVIDRLSGIRCGLRKTSCPDQFSIALKDYKERSK